MHLIISQRSHTIHRNSIIGLLLKYLLDMPLIGTKHVGIEVSCFLEFFHKLGHFLVFEKIKNKSIKLLLIIKKIKMATILKPKYFL